MTQGRSDYNQWVTSYWLSYSINNGYYQTYGENKPIVSAFNLLLKCITMLIRLPSQIGSLLVWGAQVMKGNINYSFYDKLQSNYRICFSVSRPPGANQGNSETGGRKTGQPYEYCLYVWFKELRQHLRSKITL